MSINRPTTKPTLKLPELTTKQITKPTTNDSTSAPTIHRVTQPTTTKTPAQVERPGSARILSPLTPTNNNNATTNTTPNRPVTLSRPSSAQSILSTLSESSSTIPPLKMPLENKITSKVAPHTARSIGARPSMAVNSPINNKNISTAKITKNRATSLNQQTENLDSSRKKLSTTYKSSPSSFLPRQSAIAQTEIENKNTEGKFMRLPQKVIPATNPTREKQEPEEVSASYLALLTKKPPQIKRDPTEPPPKFTLKAKTQ